MPVGFEWLIDVSECNADALRDIDLLQAVFAQLITDLNLKTLGAPLWHKFGGAGGVTGLVMLTESHLACHTYPEFRAATFNLYCCQSRPEWNWENNLSKFLGASVVTVTKIERGFQTAAAMAGQSSKTVETGGEQDAQSVIKSAGGGGGK